MVSLPIVDLNVTSALGSCGTGSCGSAGGCCGSQSAADAIRRGVPNETLQTDVSFSSRRLNLGATPDVGTFVTALDLDVTVECNLRCTYCFKEKWTEHMEDQVAFDTMIWLLYASGPHRDVTVNFMGGEPLIRFRMIKKLVPFAKRRAWQMGKSIHFGMTTNGTLVTDEVVSFWKKWGMGFHTSIDGTPEVQDRNRPTTAGSLTSCPGRGSTGIAITGCSPRITSSGPPSRPSPSRMSVSCVMPRLVGVRSADMRRAKIPPATAATYATNRDLTTPPGSRGPNSWLGWGRSFRWSARGVVAISG